MVGKILYQAKIKFERMARFATPVSIRGETVEGM